MRKFIYFINPISGTKGKQAVLDLVRSRTESLQIPYEILATNAEGDYQYLKTKVSEEKITDVIVCGGDGTVNQVAGALQKMEVNVGIIPMGSGNGLAFAAGIPKNAGKALDIIFAGKSTAIDSFLINNKFSCMLCGLGFDAQVAHDFAKQKKRGLTTYIKQSLKNFFTADPWPFSIVTENRSFSCDAWFISVANSNQFGNNFTIAPRASLSDGLLDIVIVKKMNRLKMAWKVIRQVRNGKIKPETKDDFEKDSILYFHTRHLIIQNNSMAPLHIDGDPAETSFTFNISIIEHAFRLLMP